MVSHLPKLDGQDWIHLSSSQGRWGLYKGVKKEIRHEAHASTTQAATHTPQRSYR